jgi:hypothetical protein
VWKGERGNQNEEETSNDQNNGDDDEVCDTCAVNNDDDEKLNEDEFEIDRDSFSKMLRRVSLGEARLYAQMSHLGSLAYSIPNIKVLTFLRSFFSFSLLLFFLIWGFWLFNFG